MSFEQRVREEARLIILRTLAEQIDGRLNSALLRDHLVTFGITKAREWVHQELRYLAEMGAITLVDVTSVKVACITTLGQQHVAREALIEGVKRPSQPSA